MSFLIDNDLLSVFSRAIYSDDDLDLFARENVIAKNYNYCYKYRNRWGKGNFPGGRPFVKEKPSSFSATSGKKNLLALDKREGSQFKGTM